MSVASIAVIPKLIAEPALKPERKSAFIRNVSHEEGLNRQMSLPLYPASSSRQVSIGNVASYPAFSAPELHVRVRNCFVSRLITPPELMITPPPRTPTAPMESPISTEEDLSTSTPNFIEESRSRGGAQSPNRMFEDDSECL